MMRFLWAAGLAIIVATYKNGSISFETAAICILVLVVAFFTVTIASLETQIFELKSEAKLAKERIDFLEKRV